MKIYGRSTQTANWVRPIPSLILPPLAPREKLKMTSASRHIPRTALDRWISTLWNLGRSTTKENLVRLIPSLILLPLAPREKLKMTSASRHIPRTAIDRWISTLWNLGRSTTKENSVRLIPSLIQPPLTQTSISSMTSVNSQTSRSAQDQATPASFPLSWMAVAVRLEWGSPPLHLMNYEALPGSSYGLRRQWIVFDY